MATHLDRPPVLKVVVRKVLGGPPGRYSATLDGELLIKASTRPMYAAAELLVERGVSPETLATMRHAHLDHDSFYPAPLWRWVELAHNQTRGSKGEGPTD